VIINDENLIKDVDLEKKLLKHDFNFTWISAINNAVLTEFPFPFDTKISLLITCLRVYPLLKQFIQVYFW
jgi:hypothetical protein